MTLSDLQSHSPIASLCKCNFSHSCAAVDKISTDVARRAAAIAELLVVATIRRRRADVVQTAVVSLCSRVRRIIYYADRFQPCSDN